jgi:hypothetical protein
LTSSIASVSWNIVTIVTLFPREIDDAITTEFKQARGTAAVSGIIISIATLFRSQCHPHKTPIDKRRRIRLLE